MAIPEPPWDPPRQRRPAKAPLTREAIVDAAFRVVDREGATALSMRRVAEELGTGPASLYWHVANKDALINLIVDRVIGEVHLPEPDPGAGRISSGNGCSRSGRCSTATRAWPPSPWAGSRSGPTWSA